jgi:hypothetical protein
MHFILSFFLILGTLVSISAEDGVPTGEIPFFEVDKPVKESPFLDETQRTTRISVIGMGVAPVYATSPALAYALAKRAAMVDAYRLLAEKIGGVRIEGKDTIQNMQVQRSEVRAYVQKMVKNATLVNTTFKDGICEVELEIEVKYDDFV